MCWIAFTFHSGRAGVKRVVWWALSTPSDGVKTTVSAEYWEPSTQVTRTLSSFHRRLLTTLLSSILLSTFKYSLGFGRFLYEWNKVWCTKFDAKAKSHRNEVKHRSESLVSPSHPLTASSVWFRRKTFRRHVVPIEWRKIVVDASMVEDFHLHCHAKRNIEEFFTTQTSHELLDVEVTEWSWIVCHYVKWFG